MRSTVRLLRGAHAASGLIVGVFIAVHLANHLVALAGVDAHTAYLHAVRQVYRQPAVEVPLLACFVFQAGSGIAMLARRGRPRGLLPWLQAGSGVIVALFLPVHVGAVLVARTLFCLDTDFHFAAAGMHAGAWAWFFVPYYFGAVLAVFVHVGCAVARRSGHLRAPALAASFGLPVAGLIVSCLAGVSIPVQIPAAYAASFDAGAARVAIDRCRIAGLPAGSNAR